MSSPIPPIIYTWTDEAPYLATHAFLPIVRAFAAAAGVPVETRDISLAGRVLAAVNEYLPKDRRVPDHLDELGRMVERPEANVIKLPNISASVPQLKACIEELRADGWPLPDYPDEPSTEAERKVRAAYDRAKGSAVNPVLRQGNSDRRAPAAVKAFSQANPGRMKPWAEGARTHVSTMGKDDFRANERSVTTSEATAVRIEHVGADGSTTVLKEGIDLAAGEVMDASFLSRGALLAFYRREMRDAKDSGLLLSLHLKATMMKVSDPILFGHAVRVYFRDVFERHGDTLDRLGVDPADGLADLLARVSELPDADRTIVERDIRSALETGAALAMVDSDRGITNLHVPSDVIIDASMPPMIRDGGKMWNADGELQETKALIPDSSYAGVYAAAVDDCREKGAFDPATMGTVPNVGLMAQKAEEYGSHDTTFEIAEAGHVRVVTADGDVLLDHAVEAGDVWRACRTTDVAVRDWVKLAVGRARASGMPAVFWLDRERAHDSELITKVEDELARHDTDGLDLRILAPDEAMRFTLQRVRRGEDTISVTGNVLRDYLTDLFPILEIGTSARMLSIVPLLNGGGLFETGAGGSAPKHVQQFAAEGHLRWDSLGEYMALAESLQHLAERFEVPAARVLGRALETATGEYLDHGCSPSRKVNELDNRGSTFQLARFWANALADQTEAPELADRFRPVATAMNEQESTILRELVAVQGSPVELGGYFRPDPERARAALCPSATLNRIIADV